jgi:CMP-N-acetylneuraminic acid synthetase
VKILAVIPARMGSQRLKQKNLALLRGVPLIAHAIRKCKDVPAFDEVWVNSEHDAFGDIARAEGVRFHKRPAALADHQATSEQFTYEFLVAHECDYLFQVHSIAPLLGPAEVSAFVERMLAGGFDTCLSYVPEQIECAVGGRPINFSFDRKSNSQDLEPVQRIVWSITGWRRSSYVEAVEAGRVATYCGRVGFVPISRVAGHIIKTAEDLALAEALFPR